MLEGLRSEDHELAIQQLVAGYRRGPAAGRRGHAANRWLRVQHWRRLIALDVPVIAVASAADGQHVVSGDRDHYCVGVRIGPGNLLRALGRCQWAA